MRLIDSLNPDELASELGVAKSTLARWRCIGKGPKHAIIGGRVHYMRADVEAWIAEQVAA
ncbi:TPA: helix-turn-helix domain-containing protein [Corynebacterium striatum]|uniref:helix-turn-helix transcriptional regulator n=1 Tax=Corynebacterium striatum TaxID=43770 RepID=UPI00194DFFB4|nr:helix-turn-helix domain-containing protein [Corynebacterium striatum]QRP19276.1 helix-turn-helix domain-containing protein [Corynebacterium striatum]HAT1137373.1 helix-turn-helix domain-containing protein [Corynebacterium striatum]HAT1195235.1 helix-turn-helix domain-containing protein [Corynebacterium striatum]HAT1215534.1 helix-turn-helix domain-containing protein [Corynebacterium striatum]HAT1248403.1 helix-turn-helix domain-containing protein [Corynebacterium striatum]